MKLPELDQWKLRTELRAWQVRALEAWSLAGHRGVVDAATGTGKSLVALAAMEEFVRAHDADARIVVVVPSLALARQWRSLLTDSLGVPQDEITEWHSNAPKSVGPPQRLVIAVIDSARKHIPEMIRKWNDEGHVTLLVVDECHRAGSAVNRKVFDVPPDRSLGLTATLERDDGGEEVVFDGVGPVCFSYSLLDALDDGVLAPIRSVNLYVDLTEAEQSDYDELTASLDLAMRQLRREMFSAGRDLRSNLNEIRQLAVEGHASASRVMSLVGTRAHLVRHAANRRECVRSIAGWLATTQHNVIVFHESIAGAEQSDEAFRSGVARVGDHPPVVGVSRVFIAGALTHPTTSGGTPIMTRAMDPEVADAIWAAIEPILPIPVDEHPLGCHNPRISDRLCFRGIMIRLVTGSSWVDIEAIMNFEVSDTTLRARRDEWIAAGVFDELEAHTRHAYDRILELDLDVVAVDGSIHKAPYGGEGTGKSPVDRGKLGWKWSVAVDRGGIPVGWSIDGANRNDLALLDPTIDAVADTGLIADIGTLTLDRGYDYPVIRTRLGGRGFDDLDIQRRGTKPPPGTPHRLTLGLRWIVEATNSWFSNYGQLRRSTDRRNRHRHAAIQLATAVLITARLIDYRNRWSPT